MSSRFNKTKRYLRYGATYWSSEKGKGTGYIQVLRGGAVFKSKDADSVKKKLQRESNKGITVSVHGLGTYQDEWKLDISKKLGFDVIDLGSI